jgi:hypothetical protein
MANHYDKILKENIDEILLPLAEKLLGISFENSEEIPDKIQITIEREPDFLKIIEEKYILHLEFQTADEKNMVDRMYVYHSFLWSKYHLPIKQYVIYIGDKKDNLAMVEMLDFEDFIFRFKLINMQDFRFEKFLESSKPEEIMLGILGDFHGINPKKAVKQILDRIHEIAPLPLQFGKYARQLEVLSNLRNFQSIIIKYLETMPIVYNLETDIRYQQGRGKGKEEGIELGEENQKIKSIKGLIRSKLLTNQQIAAIEEVAVEFVENIERELNL